MPELATITPATADSPVITIRHLLTHSEGFPEDNPWGDRQLARTDATFSSWLRAGIPFSTSPGTAYEYSNYGFMILGQIVQRVSGKPYAQYVHDAILVPLGMKDTVFDVRDVPPDRIAYGYRWEDEQWKPEPALPHGAGGAMGGLWTTPADLAKYVAFHLAAWPPRDDPEQPPVRRSSAREMQQMWRYNTATATRAAVDAPLTLTSSGYGYGLRISSDCRFRHIVAHGGGLPGYGSLELWLPEYGVGLIAFGNRTYTGFTPLFNETLDLLLATGGLQRRVVQPSAALVKAKDDVSKLINHWDDKLADEIAAQNFFLDQTADRRAQQLTELAKLHGNCVAEPFSDVENALRGTWPMHCDRGSLNVNITLAPTIPPKVQYLGVTSIMPPSDAMNAAIATTLSLIANWDEAKASALTNDVAKLRRLAQATRSGWGTCTQATLLAGDGVKTSVVELACEKGKVVERVTLDDGKADVAITPSRDVPCVP
jgi:CubicO group peptidase (beta-lactamase class C family)